VENRIVPTSLESNALLGTAQYSPKIDRIQEEELVFLLRRRTQSYTVTVYIFLSPSTEGVELKERMFSCVFQWKYINAN
jgi:hypothetical protein